MARSRGVVDMAWRCWLAVLCLISALNVCEACPGRCLCFRTTVRCMFLQLEHIPRTGLPPETTILDLRFNKIKDIPAGTFEGLANLNTLLLNNNGVKRLRNGAFRGLSNLRYLYLYKNEIETIENGAFEGLDKLEQLYIHFNNIADLQAETFAHLPSLERLFLHNNKLKRLPRDLFAHSENLRRLRLDSNALVCDCHMMWLAEMLKNKHGHTQAAATCKYPQNLQGRSLMSISREDFRCRKPHITMEPHDVDVTFGNTAYFTCRADGDPDPEIIWLHNDNRIIPQDHRRYSILDDGTLMIQGARDSDQGVYECLARNAAGEIRTNKVELRYFGDPVRPQFVQTPLDVTTVAGETVQFTCAAAGHPRPEITWTKNDNRLSTDSRYSLLATGALLIINVEQGDKGLYRCTAANSLDTVSASARLTIQVAPSFTVTPNDQTVVEGATVTFRCQVAGHPVPIITWKKDGESLTNDGRFLLLESSHLLTIGNVQLSHKGEYQCRAENAAGHRVTSAELAITPKIPPTFSHHLSNIQVYAGENVTFQCTAEGDPTPSYYWNKNRIRLRPTLIRSINNGQVSIINVTKDDEGDYECVAENGAGSAASSLMLQVLVNNTSFAGDRFVQQSFQEASRNVDRAVNETIKHLFNKKKVHSVQDLLQIFRYPSPEALQLARAEEVFEQTLETIQSLVDDGHRYNLDGHEKSYRELVSPGHLRLIANMSGCSQHSRTIDCSDMCFHRKYRTNDGSCNNLQNPNWGAANVAFRRLLEAAYENGFNTPVGWNKAKLYNGYHLPSARLVSSLLVSAEHITMDETNTHMLMQWGQFLDHDIDLTPQSISFAQFSDGTRCNETCENRYPCFPIAVPRSDQRIQSTRCLGFSRSSATCNSGSTSIFFNTIAPREQINSLTAYIDASNVYGSTDNENDALRDRSTPRGLLRVGLTTAHGKPLLPFDTDSTLSRTDCQIEPLYQHIPCFKAGDQRANEHLALTAMQTLLLREHNRIATELLRLNPHWDDNMLYHEARKLLGAIYQHITYAHWMPSILGGPGMDKLGSYKGYNPNLDSTVANEFATAAFRFGHTLVQPVIYRLNSTFQPIPEGNLPLHKAFFSPHRLIDEGGVDPLLRGLFGVAAKKRMPEEFLNDELTERLFSLANVVGQDLAALNIQRGRDHGLPSYNKYREICGLTLARSFHDLKRDISYRPVREKLQDLYGHVNNIDLFVGGLSETPLEGAKIGPTFMCILADQFQRLRDGDRFWYEKPGIFSPEQLVEIRQASLARLICDNSDSIDKVQPDVFTMATGGNDYVSCDDIPSINLKVWTDCCEDCGKAGNFRSITSHYRSRRHTYNDDDEGDLEPPSSRLSAVNVAGSAAVNATLLHMKDQMEQMDTRIQGMEGMMGKLNRLVRSLKKKVKRVELTKFTGNHSRLKSTKYCVDEKKIKRKFKEKWRIHDCKTCICNNGQIECENQMCPFPACAHPRKIPGQCCSEC